LELTDQPVVFGVMSDPEPKHVITGIDGQRSVM
jgi:hypothetical protein